jgi:hypothetical protein
MVQRSTAAALILRTIVREPMMSYTLWSRGRLLGTSELDYRRGFAKHRMGDFYPTDIGATLMPIATGVSPTGIGLARVVSGTSAESSKSLSEEEIRKTSEYADFAAAVGHQEALELELHGPDGAVISTEWIDVRDTEFLLSLLDDDLMDGIGRDADLRPWDTEDSDSGDEDATDDFEAWLDSRGRAAWSPEIEESDADDDAGEFPRYQLHVMLRDAGAVP